MMICFNGGKYVSCAGICCLKVDGEEVRADQQVEAPVSPVTKCTSIGIPRMRMIETAIYLGRWINFPSSGPIPWRGLRVCLNLPCDIDISMMLPELGNGAFGFASDLQILSTTAIERHKLRVGTQDSLCYRGPGRPRACPATRLRAGRNAGPG